ncbi:potassium-transporting ATPase subunit KdpC [Nocardioides panzhihuensis]|uniref:Potassium-transporting ATPase KdpC subunit n=1 Tax=Nocardioides panzhihuensis TaxID=860243 RepID=A0A7Z0IQC0_9ACTN|nr:potassium-transporting ATPase subunit KdpC [Nocardioides panzhihuensis]NYI75605.1 K+-transporting ATPase ATPase C chain [Nocardioides panzhihuensis]
MSDLFALLRHSLAGLRVLIAATLLCGIAYPLVVTGVAQTAFGWRADGSLVTEAGVRTHDPAEAVGSALIGQRNDDEGLFYPRPSAAGDGWDTLATAGSNLGPEDPGLVDAIKERRRDVAAREGVSVDQVPADAVTASASGIDPDISPAYAALQVSRVARDNGLSEDAVAALVAEHTDDRTFGFLGEPRVNVLELNIAVRGEVE